MQAHLATTLKEIIVRSFDGNRSKFSKLCGVSHVTIGRFCHGEVSPTLEKLTEICSHLKSPDRKRLLLAAARDRVPEIYQDEIFGSVDQASDMIRASLSPDLAAVISYLEKGAMNDPSTAEYLRRIGKWVGLIQEQETQALKVAEDETPYGTKKK